MNGLDVVVVGGGISGLVAAHSLRKDGAAVTLVEASSRLGGKVLTEIDEGFLIESGPDSFVAGKGSVLALAAELGLTESVIATRPENRGSYVWWEGRLHPLPDGLLLMAPSRLGPLLGSSLLSWPGKLRVLADLVLPRRNEPGDESLQSFVERRLGHEVLERIAEPLIAGIHAAEPSTMSLQASFPRFLQMEQDHRSLILAARAAASRRPGSGSSHFASFERGMGQLTGALSEALAGADIRTDVSVTGLAHGDGAYQLRLDRGTALRADGVVLATPSVVTADLLSGISPPAAHALAGIHQVATSVVTLAFRTHQLPPLSGSGFVVPAAQARHIMGVSYLSRKWRGRVPDQGFELLRVFVGGPHGQDLALAGEDRLLGVALDELEAMLGIAAKPARTWAHPWEGGLHQYTLGHTNRVSTAEAALAAHPGLALAGGAFHGIGLNECIDSGRRAAVSVLESSTDRGRSERVAPLTPPGRN
ncbi:MAG: protoporphyrinogen oxidase [Acidimicrobiia bacterium]